MIWCSEHRRPDHAVKIMVDLEMDNRKASWNIIMAFCSAQAPGATAFCNSHNLVLTTIYVQRLPGLDSIIHESD